MHVIDMPGQPIFVLRIVPACEVFRCAPQIGNDLLAEGLPNGKTRERDGSGGSALCELIDQWRERQYLSGPARWYRHELDAGLRTQRRVRWVARHVREIE